MGVSAIGTVGLVKFPFADRKGYKVRPALVVAHGSLDTVIICQITSRSLPGMLSATLTKTDFTEGSLPLDSYIRPDKLFTIAAARLSQQLGRINEAKLQEVREIAQNLFT